MDLKKEHQPWLRQDCKDGHYVYQPMDEIHCKPTDSHSNADRLSRLPLPTVTTDKGGESLTIFDISRVQSLPVTFQQVQQVSKQDAILSKVLHYMKDGCMAKSSTRRT